jgi:hypothetical protein
MSDNNTQILNEMCKTDNIKAFVLIDKQEFEKITGSKPYVLPFTITDILLQDIHLCDNYKSDLLVSIQTLQDEIKDLIIHPDLKSKHVVFGYRKNGVDGNLAFIVNFKTWCEQHNYSMAANYYRRCYIAEIGIVDDNFAYKEIYGKTAQYYNGDIYILLYNASNNIILK